MYDMQIRNPVVCDASKVSLYSHSPKMGTITEISCRLNKYMNYYNNLIEMAYKIHFLA